MNKELSTKNLNIKEHYPEADDFHSMTAPKLAELEKSRRKSLKSQGVKNIPILKAPSEWSDRKKTMFYNKQEQYLTKAEKESLNDETHLLDDAKEEVKVLSEKVKDTVNETLEKAKDTLKTTDTEPEDEESSDSRSKEEDNIDTKDMKQETGRIKNVINTALRKKNTKVKHYLNKLTNTLKAVKTQVSRKVKNR